MVEFVINLLIVLVGVPQIIGKMEERKKLIGIIKLWLEDNAKNLSTYELKQIIHYCNGGDAIYKDLSK